MKFSIVIKPSLGPSTLREQILKSDVLISDLDDTDALSPGKKIAWNALSRKVLKPKLWLWALKAGYRVLSGDEAGGSKSWKEYIKLFLRDHKEIKRAKEKLTNDEIERLLYPGIQELYKILSPKMYKVYFTRNILPIGWLFYKFLEFDEVIAEVFDKGKATAQFVKNNPQFKTYFVKGDSIEDKDILDVLEFYKRKGRIENVVSCYRANSEKKINRRFDVNVGGNYLKLVEILKGGS